MLGRSLLLVAAFTLAACTSSPVRNGALHVCAGERVLEVTALANSDLYLWNEDKVSTAQLQSKVDIEHQSCPVSEIRLLRGGRNLTIANSIEIGEIAQSIGAKAQYEHATLGLKPIDFSD